MLGGLLGSYPAQMQEQDRGVAFQCKAGLSAHASSAMETGLYDAPESVQADQGVRDARYDVHRALKAIMIAHPMPLRARIEASACGGSMDIM